MRHETTILLVVLTLVLLSGCDASTPATSVLVEVTSDLAVGSELVELRVQVFDRAGTEQLGLHEIRLTTLKNQPAAYELPASFALSPTERSVRDCRIVVTGRGSLDAVSVVDVVEAQAVAVFVENEQARLTIHLARACLGQLCRGPTESRSDLTCSAGACVTLPLSALAPEFAQEAGDASSPLARELSPSPLARPASAQQANDARGQ